MPCTCGGRCGKSVGCEGCTTRAKAVGTRCGEGVERVWRGRGKVAWGWRVGGAVAVEAAAVEAAAVEAAAVEAEAVEAAAEGLAPRGCTT